MSFQSYLEHLRTKPDHIKKRIAFWSSFTFTAIVFMFWIGSFSALGSSPAGQKVADVFDARYTPAQSLIAGVGSLFETLRDSIFGVKKVEFSTVEVIAGDR
ncbi:MAG: hypothetical protein AAB381_02830 [Patescibacteria group bacterium]